MNPLLVQILAYAVVIALGFFSVSFILKGFFLKYLRVRGSMGSKVMVKVRNQLRDWYVVGWVEEEFLCYNVKGESFFDKVKVRIVLPKNEKVFYKSLGILFIDVDEEKKAICCTNYEPITGYDAVKFDALIKRALYRPSIGNQIEKVILILCIVILLAAIIIGFIVYKDYKLTQTIVPQIANLIATSKGTVIGGGI